MTKGKVKKYGLFRRQISFYVKNPLFCRHVSIYYARRFLGGPNFCTKFDSLNHLFKRRASYHFKA